MAATLRPNFLAAVKVAASLIIYFLISCSGGSFPLIELLQLFRTAATLSSNCGSCLGRQLTLPPPDSLKVAATPFYSTPCHRLSEEGSLAAVQVAATPYPTPLAVTPNENGFKMKAVQVAATPLANFLATALVPASLQSNSLIHPLTALRWLLTPFIEHLVTGCLKEPLQQFRWRLPRSSNSLTQIRY